MKLFGKKSTNAPDPVDDPVASIIVSLDTKTQQLRIVGNIVTNKEATIGILIEALRAVHNGTLQSQPAPVTH